LRTEAVIRLKTKTTRRRKSCQLFESCQLSPSALFCQMSPSALLTYWMTMPHFSKKSVPHT
jgi:hypothetical protein